MAIDKAKPPTSAAKWQGNDQTNLQCQTARHNHHQIQWVTCTAWHWGSGPHSEGEKAPLVWTCGTLQWCSQDSLWPTGWWKAWAWEAKDDMEAADREGLQRLEALGYQPSWLTYMEIRCEICHTCSKPATWKGAHWCGCCPCNCMLIKNMLMMNDDDGAMVKSSRWQIGDMFLIFPRKQDLTCHANYLHWRQFAWNVRSYFLWKI